MKKCSGCGIEKSLDCFSKKKITKDGLQPQCKECNSKYFSKNKHRFSERIVKYQSEYRRKNADKKRNLESIRRNLIKNDLLKFSLLKLQNKESSKRSIKRYPEKTKARHAVKWALKSGKIMRPSSCSSCGNVCIPNAHHDSYDESQWLNVRWLCKSCHAAHHRKYPEIKNIQKA